jgi:hypothetical protein
MYKALDLWLPAYLRRARYRKPPGVVHILLAVCDHFEPLHDADKKTAMNRLAQWQQHWPALVNEFKDADGVRPRHTFFYPIEQYDKGILDSLTEICQSSGAEVEIHLHHDNDTAAGLRKKLEKGKEDLLRHNLLSKDESGRVCYGFIHGNWALDNSHPHRHNCGVSNELKILKETGCFGDFTMPSAPDPAQTRIVNSLYYATGTPTPKSHDTGILARVKKSKEEKTPGDLLLIQGALGLNWRKRKFGVIPRIENSDLTLVNPPRPDRMAKWLDLGIHVQGRPDCVFIKLHTHAGIPRNMKLFFGDLMRGFHQHLMEHYRDTREYRLHYVSAREMVNILHAIEDGATGEPGQFRDYRYRSLLKR